MFLLSQAEYLRFQLIRFEVIGKQYNRDRKAQIANSKQLVSN